MRTLFAVLFVAVLSWLLGAWIVVKGNPEVRFWVAAYEARLLELRDERVGEDETVPHVLFTGGSSCAFSVDPEIIEERTGRPAYNLGGPAAAGMPFLVDLALQEAKSGDVLVLALERHFLAEPDRVHPTRLGIACAVDMGRKDLVEGGDWVPYRLPPHRIADEMRPGLRFLSTLGGKMLLRRDPYRYEMDDLRARGRMETDYRDQWKRAVGQPPELSLSAEGREFLSAARDEAAGRGVTICYSLPWLFTEERWVDANRARHKELLNQVAAIVPVLEDRAFGVRSNPDDFSDSEYHLTAEGSRERSSRLAEGLLQFLDGNE